MASHRGETEEYSEKKNCLKSLILHQGIAVQKSKLINDSFKKTIWICVQKKRLCHIFIILHELGKTITLPSVTNKKLLKNKFFKKYTFISYQYKILSKLKKNWIPWVLHQWIGSTKKNSAVCVRTRTVNVNTFSSTVKDEISEGW